MILFLITYVESILFLGSVFEKGLSKGGRVEKREQEEMTEMGEVISTSRSFFTFVH